MNQILFTNNNSTNNNSTNNKFTQKSNSKKKFFKTQFITSVTLLLITILLYFYNWNNRSSKEKISKHIANNYSISQLYNNKNYSNSTYSQNGQIFMVIGMIEIPKINIYYPIISESNDELLKISPCRISGPMPNEDGNLCIAGHNYDNYKFFSKISNLKKDDETIKTADSYNVTDMNNSNASLDTSAANENTTFCVSERFLYKTCCFHGNFADFSSFY